MSTIQAQKNILFVVGVVGFACGFAVVGGLEALFVATMFSNGFTPAGLGWITLPILGGFTGAAIAKSQYIKYLTKKVQGLGSDSSSR